MAQVVTETENVSPVVDAIRLFAHAATASAAGATAVYPVDLIKTRMQAQSKVGKTVSSATLGADRIVYRNSWDCFKSVVRFEGARALYKGLLPQLVAQVPEKAIRLLVVNQLYSLFRQPNGEITTGMEIVAGSCAGLSQVLITNPAEVIKVRMQVAGAVKEAPVGAIEIARQLGLRNLYRGAGACFLRDIPYSAIYFPMYAKLKEMFKDETGNVGAHKLMVAGSLAGVLAASVTCPADVIKTRLQVAPRKNEVPYKGIVDCVKRLLKVEGPSALFKGLAPRVLRSAPQYGVMLAVFELLQELFSGQVDTTVQHSAVVQVGHMAAASWLNWEAITKIEDKEGLLYENKWKMLLENKWGKSDKAAARITRFVEIAGGLKNISVGSTEYIWGVSASGDVFRWTGRKWKYVEAPPMTRVAVGNDGTIWGLDFDGKVYSFTKGSNVWRPVYGMKMKDISIGNIGDIWGVTFERDVYRWTGSTWKQVKDTKLRRVSVGGDGTCWGLGESNDIYRWNGLVFQQLPGKLMQISVGSADNVYGVAEDGGVYKWANGVFKRMGAPHQHISAGYDGTVLAVDSKE